MRSFVGGLIWENGWERPCHPGEKESCSRERSSCTREGETCSRERGSSSREGETLEREWKGCLGECISFRSSPRDYSKEWESNLWERCRNPKASGMFILCLDACTSMCTVVFRNTSNLWVMTEDWPCFIDWERWSCSRERETCSRDWVSLSNGPRDYSKEWGNNLWESCRNPKASGTFILCLDACTSMCTVVFTNTINLWVMMEDWPCFTDWERRSCSREQETCSRDRISLSSSPRDYSMEWGSNSWERCTNPKASGICIYY